LNELKDVASGEIRVGMPPLVGTIFFPEMAAKFHKRYPNVKLELIEEGAKIVEQLIEKEEIDVGLVVLPVDEEKFHVYPFVTEKFYLYVHVEHRLSKSGFVTLQDLKEEKLIVFSKHFTLHSYIIDSCKQAGFSPQIAYESSQWDLTIELVAARLGVALLPESVMKKQNHSSIRAVPVANPPLLWRLGVITKKGSYHSFALKKWLEMVFSP
jgi:DNA-binding transcriptional LysR family regulator